MIASSTQGGYTLLEVVVALSILALSIGAVSESFSMSLRRSERVRNLESAALLADSVRARLGVDIPLDGMQHADTAGDCHWQVDSKQMPSRPQDMPASPRAWQAHIDAACGSGIGQRDAQLEVFEVTGAAR